MEENIRTIEENIRTIEENVASLGFRRGEVLIVAATKMVDAERINRLKDYGIMDAGENRVQELMQKYDHVSGIRWHFIGNLQRNKVKYIIDKVCLIHSVDNASLASEIDKRAQNIDKTIDILVEVNIGREPTKGGVMAENLAELCDHILTLKNVRLRGLMSVLPRNADLAMYKQMQQLYAQTQQKYGKMIEFLSVGMSDDYQTAIKFGANIIRPGSAIFGKRSY